MEGGSGEAQSSCYSYSLVRTITLVGGGGHLKAGCGSKVKNGLHYQTHPKDEKTNA